MSQTVSTHVSTMPQSVCIIIVNTYRTAHFKGVNCQNTCQLWFNTFQKKKNFIHYLDKLWASSSSYELCLKHVQQKVPTPYQPVSNYCSTMSHLVTSTITNTSHSDTEDNNTCLEPFQTRSNNIPRRFKLISQCHNNTTKMPHQRTTKYTQ